MNNIDHDSHEDRESAAESDVACFDRHAEMGIDINAAALKMVDWMFRETLNTMDQKGGSNV